MDKETKNIIFIAFTLILNIIAPILLINTIQDYTKSSKVYGNPSVYEVSEYVNSSDYLFQENLSTISYTAETDNDVTKYTYNYYFESIDLDTTKNNYSVFINDYICTTNNLEARSITGTHLHNFYDINKNLINSIELTIEFKSYTTYSTLLISITATDNDLSYWNSYCSNPGFVLTLSKVDYGMSGNLYTPIDPTTEYAVNFIVDDEVISSQTLLFGEYATLPDYELNNCAWSLDGLNVVDVATYQILGDTTFVLIEPFTLNFNTNGSPNVFDSKKLYYSQVYGELPTPVRDGYVFNGWYTDITGGDEVTTTTIMGDMDTTVYAQWTAINYSISFNGNGATSGSMDNQAFTYGEAKALSSNAFTRDEYKFIGWSTSPDGEVEYLNGATILNLTSNIETVTLYAVWTNHYYTAQVYTMGTSGWYPSGYSTLTIPSATGLVDITEDANTSSYVVENGLVLDKITDLDGNIISSVDVAEDNSTVVKFYYKRIQHILTLDANGGTISNVSGWTISSDNKTATKTLYYQQAYSTLPTPIRSGYTFIGWFTEATGGTQVSSTSFMKTSDTTIYAQWQEN